MSTETEIQLPSTDQERSFPFFVFAVFVVACGLFYFAISDPDVRTWSLWKNTLRLAGGTILLAVPAGVVAAVLIHRTDAWGRNGAWFALIALLFIPIYLQAAGWDAWFGRQSWLWHGPRAPTYRLLVAIWIHSAAAIPWVAMIVGGALLQIAPELEESASLDMPIAAVLARITIPLCLPAILLSCWWIGIMTAAEMTVTDIYQVRTYAEEVYTTIQLLESASFRELATQTSMRAAWIMAGWVGLSLLVISLIARHEYPSSVRRHVVFTLGGWRSVASLVLLAIVAIIVVIPLFNLCRDAGTYVETAAGDGQRLWSPQKFVKLLVTSPWRFRRELGWTAVIGASAATVTTIFATGFAWLARRKSLAGLLPLFAATVAATVPGPIVALAIISVMNREASDFCVWLYDRTILAPVLSGAIRAMPVAIAVIWWGLRTVPTELIDMAQLDGLGFLGRMRHVVWPARRELLIAAWCASFAFAAGDLAATVLVIPPGVFTLSIRIFGLLHAGVDDQVAAVCLVNILLCIVLAMVVKRLVGRSVLSAAVDL
jgi:iron(III) transport system permease protein